MTASKLLWTIICVALLITLVMDNALAMLAVSLVGSICALAVLLPKLTSR